MQPFWIPTNIINPQQILIYKKLKTYRKKKLNVNITILLVFLTKEVTNPGER